MTTTSTEARRPATGGTRTTRAVAVVPTYQEAATVDTVLDRLLGLDLPDGTSLDVLVVDDSSPDGTGDRVLARAAVDDRVRLLSRTGREGLGAAYRAGFAAALEAGYDAVVQLDADGSHPAAAVPAMLARLAAGEADVVIGSRYVAGGGTEGWPWQRRALSGAANLYARGVLRLRTHDATAGFRAWTADAVRRTGVLTSRADGYGFQVENTWHAERAGLRVLEHPITFVDRTEGDSKMSTRTALEAVRLIAGWGAASVPVPVWVGVLAVLTALARLPFLTTALTSDEGGFLMVAAQWSPGSSLYGDYWVDRPPLIVAIFGLAHLLGTAGGLLGETIALRLLGLVWAAAAVVLAGALGAALARRSRGSAVAGLAPRPPETGEEPRDRRAGTARLLPLLLATLTAALVTSPLFGADQVDGELLALPFLLAGLLAVVRTWSARSRTTSVGWWALAGVCAVAAPAVKQNMLGVALAAAVSLLVLASRGHRRAALRGLLACGAALLVTLGALLAVAAWRGTDPAGLWEAVVTFRLQASAVISSSASSATPARARALLLAAVASGAVLLPLLAVAASATSRVRPVRGGVPLGLLALVVTGWETLGVLLGGSYWHHYLVGTIPGLLLCAAVVVEQRPQVQESGWARRALVGVVAYAAVVTMVALPIATVMTHRPTSETAVTAYLAAHARPGDTGVTAFGDPQLLHGVGLTSPYEELWSLPARVRDPGLTELTAVLRDDSPTWVVTTGTDIATWGVDATTADRVLASRYRLVDTEGDWSVYRLDG
ncbi:polyprenol monophosphomannose synthase [Nocardioides bruguierae]|uniref:polyprenol monophosphomannose synthase n=1 Tax=Nocardioides bruguierae TaxID=2945102 RepID=UPI00202218A4|nr:polyprenol monophosphomannose synthase [Nocardioides bruguierae]MCL8024880.1 polyprenol monophosphomannose synthase [Nocardioides bruguierae]